MNVIVPSRWVIVQLHADDPEKFSVVKNDADNKVPLGWVIGLERTIEYVRKCAQPNDDIVVNVQFKAK